MRQTDRGVGGVDAWLGLLCIGLDYLGLGTEDRGSPQSRRPGVFCRVVSQSRVLVVLFDMMRHDGGEGNTEVGPEFWSERNYFSLKF